MYERRLQNNSPDGDSKLLLVAPAEIAIEVLKGVKVSILSCLRKVEEPEAQGVYITLCGASPIIEEHLLHVIFNQQTPPGFNTCSET